MTWQFYLGLGLGVTLGGLIGWLIGRYSSSQAVAVDAARAIDEADKSADEAREQIDAETRDKLEKNATASGKELLDAINKDYSTAPTVPGVVLRVIPGAATTGSERADKPAIKLADGADKPTS